MKSRHAFFASFFIFALAAMILAGCSSSDSPTDPGGGGPSVWFVDRNAAGTGDGRSWDNAFDHPSDAMAAASSGDQIWVAMATYYGPGDRSEPVIAFKSGVNVYGGFAGGETDLSQRDIASSRARLHGGDTLYSVVTGADNTLLHGFLITGGNADQTTPDNARFGGGIYCLDATMRISNCLIFANSAGGGGGIYAGNETVTIDSCRIIDNASTEDGYNSSGGGGLSVIMGGLVMDRCEIVENTAADKAGGMLLYNSSATVTSTDFSDNSVTMSYRNGGGMLVLNSQTQAIRPEFINCRFESNSAAYGGAAFLQSSSPLFSECEFETNTATMSGSAINTYNSSYLMEHCVVTQNEGTSIYNWGPLGAGVPRIFNCLFWNNDGHSNYGGAIFNNTVNTEIECCTIVGNLANNGGGIYSSGACSPVVTNCIIWDNMTTAGDAQIHDTGGAATIVTYTDIDQDGYDGAGLFNIRAIPLWVTGPRGDFYLHHIATGQISDSPCIDAGSNTSISYLLHTMTTRTDDVVDAGQVDLGFHYELDD